MTATHARHTMHEVARPVANLVARIANAASNFLRAWKNRREFYRLGEMSDAELSDIGLTRSDLTVVVDLPFGSDPTARLGSISRSRLNSVEDMARRVS
jgi:uncharacterized protein YjiS (DUF1127 family)